MRLALRRRSRGVSLIEAMVALAVMGFGTLAVLGVQTSLRMNGDIARQRGEAVRIGQTELQAARAWATMAQYDALESPDEDEERLVGNTLYTVRRTVADAAAADPNQPRRKTVVLAVLWTDRAGQAQGIRLNTAIHGAAPVLAGSLAVPADAAFTRNPGGRHRAVPRDATPMPGGRSLFRPPGGGSVRWVFDNLTGYITQVCSAATAESCIGVDARLLAGYVRFATSVAPTVPPDAVPPATVAYDAAAAEAPPGDAVPVDVAMGSVACYEEAPDATGAVAYFCAVPVNDERKWSGRAAVAGRTDGSLPLIDSRSDADAAKYQVCRYTPVRGCQPAVGSTIWGAPGATASCTGTAPTPQRRMRNADHPLDYLDVTESLVNQNFLVIRAGDGSTAYDCPPDDATTPYANTNTWHHQPPT